MKTVNLRVGAKGERQAVTVPVQVADTLEDMQALARNTLGVIIRCFNRGYRIESQERSGAREAFREGKSVEEIAQLVATYDPTVVKPRVGRTATPKKVTLKPGKKSYTPDEIAALLASAGIKATLEVEGAAPSA